MSYKIFTADTVICDSTNHANGVEKPVVSQVANKVWSLEFTIYPEHPYYDTIEEHVTELGVQMDDEVIFFGEVYRIKTDFSGGKQVFCEDMLGYLNDALIAPHRYNSMNVADILHLAVDQYNLQCPAKPIAYGIVQTTHTAHNLAFSTNYTSALTVVMENVIKKVGGYVRMRYENGVRYLDYSEDFGGTTQVIAFGSNLIDFVRDSDKSKLVSVLIPLGERLPDDQQTVEGVELRLTTITEENASDRIAYQPLIAEIGRVVRTRIWDNVSDPVELFNLGLAYLRNQVANVTIEARAFDLNLADEDFDRIKLYDEVRVISEPHGLDSRFPVLELTYNLDDPASNKITLGKTDIPSLTSTTAGVAEALQAVPTFRDVQYEAARQAALALENATNGYIQFVYNDTTGVLEQILIKDLTDPDNKWWRWNVNGLGYTSDGGQTYDVALTMLGRLVSNDAIIGGWEVNSSGLYKTVADPNDPTKQYRVTIYTPNANSPDSTPVISFLMSTDGGQSFNPKFTTLGSGSIVMYTDNSDQQLIQILQEYDSTTVPGSTNYFKTMIASGYVETGGRTWNINPLTQESYKIDSHTRLYSFGGIDAVRTYYGFSLLPSGLDFRYGYNTPPAGGGDTTKPTATYPSAGWRTATVSDSYVSGGTTTWRYLTNGTTAMAICSRTFTNVAADYAWGNIFCGPASGGGLGCNFKSCAYPRMTGDFAIDNGSGGTTTYFQFKGEPTVIAQLSVPAQGNDGWIVSNAAWTQANPSKFLPAYDLARGTSGTLSSVTVNYIVFGEIEAYSAT